MPRVAAACLFAWFLMSPALVAQQNLVDNGAFDGDIAGWAVTAEPDSTVAWSAFGNPDGSLRIESTWDAGPSTLAIIVRGPCLQLPYGYYELTGDVFPDLAGSGTCHIDLLSYHASSDCTGSESNGDNSTGVSGSWQTLVYPTETGGAGTSYRIGLTLMKNAVAGASSCNFDNITLFGPPSSAIPTLGQASLATLALVVAICGLAALRKVVE